MTTKKFSKGEAIRFGWNTMKSNLGFFIGFLVAGGLLYGVFYVAAGMVMKVNVPLGVILYIASFVLTTVITMGLVKTILRFCDKERGRFSDLFSQYRLFFKYFFAYILYSLITLVGTLLLIVPGIIWGIKFWFFDYFVIDKGLGPIEALKKSSAITRGVKWNLFVFFLMFTGINLLGILLGALLGVLFGILLGGLLGGLFSILFISIGFFATISTTMVAAAFVYRKLLAQVETTETTEITEKDM